MCLLQISFRDKGKHGCKDDGFYELRIVLQNLSMK
jgi:hypothetical protein